MDNRCASALIIGSSKAPCRLKYFTCGTLLGTAVFSFAVAGAQEKPLSRAFQAGASRSYRVVLRLQTEVRGISTEQIGEKTYARPFVREAEAQASWAARVRVTAVSADGTAEVEEEMGEFQMAAGPPAENDEASKRLAEALREALTIWTRTRTLRYREAQDGQLNGVEAAGAPPLAEEAPPVLTLWLVHALRPAAKLPNRPVQLGAGWEELRQVNLAPWMNVSGSESGEWLAAGAGGAPGPSLHIVQQIRGSAAGRGTDGKGMGLPAGGGQGKATFFAESLVKLSLLDGSVVQARRSASREIVWTLAPVEGLPDPPQFRTRLSATVTIERE
jgi:hypothetical protein